MQRFSQRIDSEASSGNNGWGERVGALDVECAWGTLARNTVVPWGANIIVLEDVTVPSLKTLTFDGGVVFKFDAVDQSASGSDSGENELIISGTLDVNGGSGDEVTFQSSQGSPAAGDWYGIRIENSAVTMDYAVVKHAQYGVRVNGQGGGTDHITHCTFQDNQTYDLDIENSDSGGLYLDVTTNTFTVGAGSGIHINDPYTSGLVVNGNSLTCSSSTTDGIYVNSTHADLDITGNTISGGTNGQGINLAAAEGFIRGNTISNCKYGIRVAGGTPVLGPETGGQAGNTISSCGTAGILTTGSGVDPLIRFNTSTGNASGLRCDSSSDPDAGNGSDDGDNDFAGNSSYAIRNTTSNTISAIGNWFGDCMSFPSIQGSVDISNQLCVDPTSRARVGTEPITGGPRVMVTSLSGAPGNVRFVVEGVLGRSDLALALFDVSGRLLREFRLTTDGSSLDWDGADASGDVVRSGVYFVRLKGDRDVLGITKFVYVR